MAATRQRAHFTIPGLNEQASAKTVTLLQERLVALIDLQLTLKHVHWNVVGPTFIGVHQMLDPQVVAVQGMVDTTAERIAMAHASSGSGRPSLIFGRCFRIEAGVGANSLASMWRPIAASTIGSGYGASRSKNRRSTCGLGSGWRAASNARFNSLMNSRLSWSFTVSAPCR